jgi:hypothetical protein
VYYEKIKQIIEKIGEYEKINLNLQNKLFKLERKFATEKLVKQLKENSLK